MVHAASLIPTLAVESPGEPFIAFNAEPSPCGGAICPAAYIACGSGSLTLKLFLPNAKIAALLSRAAHASIAAGGKPLPFVAARIDLADEAHHAFATLTYADDAGALIKSMPQAKSLRIAVPGTTLDLPTDPGSRRTYAAFADACGAAAKRAGSTSEPATATFALAADGSLTLECGAGRRPRIALSALTDADLRRWLTARRTSVYLSAQLLAGNERLDLIAAAILPATGANKSQTVLIVEGGDLNRWLTAAASNTALRLVSGARAPLTLPVGAAKDRLAEAAAACG
ncbi:MAG: hypothetical protein U1E56_12700 [Bauldia sp.]